MLMIHPLASVRVFHLRLNLFTHELNELVHTDLTPLEELEVADFMGFGIYVKCSEILIEHEDRLFVRPFRVIHADLGTGTLYTFQIMASSDEQIYFSHNFKDKRIRSAFTGYHDKNGDVKVVTCSRKNMEKP